LCACSGDDDATSTGVAPSSTTPERPSADVRFEGGVGLDGAISQPSVRCRVPDLKGSSIAVLGQPRGSALQARIAVQQHRVQVVVSSGEGSSYHERAFEGNGVSDFDAAHGAVVDSQLHEVASTSISEPGSVGAVTAIRGRVDCGDQTAGSSTVTITGETPDGPLASATLDPVRVECDASPEGNEVYASGITRTGSRRVLLAIGLTTDGAVTVNKNAAAGSRQYRADGSTSITPRGAKVHATVIERDATPAHSLEVTGDLTCGLNAAG
jgi:hypothetical protein